MPRYHAEGPRARQRVTRDRDPAGTEDDARVAVVFRLGDAGLLEVELVPDGVVGLRHESGRPHGSARSKRYAETDHAAKAIRAQLGRVPGHIRTPIVAGDDRPVGPESVEQADHITENVKQCVLVDRVGTVGLAIAAHVGRHGPEPSLGERGELMAPGVPELGKAVAQHDERTGRRLRRGAGPDAVGLDGAVRHFVVMGPRPPCRTQRRRKKSIIAALTSAARSCWVQ